MAAATASSSRLRWQCVARQPRRATGGSPFQLLGGDGVTANDAGDADAGSNALQNYPVLVSATVAGGATTITGSINSTANTTLRLEFVFEPDRRCERARRGCCIPRRDQRHHRCRRQCELQRNAVRRRRDGGHAVSATATVSLGGGNYGSTSEFAANVVAALLQAPVVGVPGAIDPGRRRAGLLQCNRQRHHDHRRRRCRRYGRGHTERHAGRADAGRHQWPELRDRRWHCRCGAGVPRHDDRRQRRARRPGVHDAGGVLGRRRSPSPRAIRWSSASSATPASPAATPSRAAPPTSRPAAPRTAR